MVARRVGALARTRHAVQLEDLAHLGRGLVLEDLHLDLVRLFLRARQEGRRHVPAVVDDRGRGHRRLQRRRREPCPKAIVIELIFFHCLGCVGIAVSGSSVLMRDRRPMRVRNSLCPSMPTRSASRAEPTFEDTRRSRARERAALAVELLDREAGDAEGRRREHVVVAHEAGIQRHRGREDLEGRPISNVPAEMRLRFSFFSASPGKSGRSPAARPWR